MTPCGEAYQMNEGRVNRSGSGEEETYGGKWQTAGKANQQANGLNGRI